MKPVSQLSMLTRAMGEFLPDQVLQGHSWEINANQVASTLKAPRYLVMDILQVMEAILLVTEIGSHQYRWNGFAHLTPALKLLASEIQHTDLPQRILATQEEAIERIAQRSHITSQHLLAHLTNQTRRKVDSCDSYQWTVDNLDGVEISAQRARRCSPRKSLLTQYLIGACLHSENHMANLHTLSRVMGKPGSDLASIRLYAKRFHDITSVLTSLKYPIIERVQVGNFHDRSLSEIVSLVAPDSIHAFAITPDIINSLPRLNRQPSFLLWRSLLRYAPFLATQQDALEVESVRVKCDGGFLVRPRENVHWGLAAFENIETPLEVESLLRVEMEAMLTMDVLASHHQSEVGNTSTTLLLLPGQDRPILCWTPHTETA